MPAILGIDGGFANTGVVSAFLQPDGKLYFLNAWHVRTAKDKTARSVAYDNLRRTRELVEELSRILSITRPVTICAESMSHPRNASTAGKLSLFWGAFASLVDVTKDDIRLGTPQAIRKAVMLGGPVTAEMFVHEKLRSTYPDLNRLANGFTKDNAKHILDAAAAVVALGKD